jgi:hypothetical protein
MMEDKNPVDFVVPVVWICDPGFLKKKDVGIVEVPTGRASTIPVSGFESDWLAYLDDRGYVHMPPAKRQTIATKRSR